MTPYLRYEPMAMLRAYDSRSRSTPACCVRCTRNSYLATVTMYTRMVPQRNNCWVYADDRQSFSIGASLVLTHSLAFWCYHRFQAFSKLIIRVRHYEMESILIGPIFAKSIFYFYWFVVLVYMIVSIRHFPRQRVAGKCYNIYRIYVILF